MSSSTSRLSLGSFIPRYAESRQWTSLPSDFLDKVVDVFKRQFVAESKKGEFLAEGRIYGQEIVVRIGYLESGRLRQVNFEASIDVAPLVTPPGVSLAESLGEAAKASGESDAQSQSMDRLYICIDFLGGIVEEFFSLDENEEIDVPDRWQPFDFEGQTVYLQRSSVNSRLESEADRLLGLDKKDLYQEQETTEDALSKAEVDSDLAFAVQKAIREGNFPRGSESEN